MLWTARNWVAPLIILTCVVATADPGCSELLQRILDNTMPPMPHSKLWGNTTSKDILVELHYRSRVRPSSLLVGCDHPNGIRFLVMFASDGVRVPLPLYFDNAFEGFDEFGDLNKDYGVQVVEHDFDRYDTPEIIVAVGNELTNLVVNIITYHAPASEKDASREENWSLIGSFTGQAHASIKGNAITLPIGSQGVYDEYTWVKDTFVKTN
jgi:hypothetical protein